jgi:hypothetical protein
VENKGTLETPRKIAAHESPRITTLYDRTDDWLTLDEIEKISVRNTSGEANFYRLFAGAARSP